MTKKLAILLLDDDQDVADVMRDAVEFSFPDLVFLRAETVSISKALFRTWEDSLILVLVDMLLGGETGLDFYRWVMQSPGKFKGLIAGFTASTASEKQLQAEGCARMLSKPCSIDELESLIRDGFACFRTP